jgi:TatD DNase family protein
VATYKNGGLDKVLPSISLDQMVLETDSPYLAPVPFRGKRNEPAYLSYISERVAEIMDIDVDKLVSRSTINALRLFENG